MKVRIANKIEAARAKPPPEHRGGYRKPGRKPGKWTPDERLKCACGNCKRCRSRLRARAKTQGLPPPVFPDRWKRKVAGPG